MKNLLVYGTLLNNEVVYAITGKEFSSFPCTLGDYEVKMVKDQYYPGMIKSVGETADGIVLQNVDDESFAKIVHWEGNDYQLINMKVKHGSKELEVSTFIWNGSSELNGGWDNEKFRQRHMQACISEYETDS